MMDYFRTAVLRSSLRSHLLSDEAVRYAVGLNAQVHNLLAAYEQGLTSGDFTKFSAKLYELSYEFHEPEAKEHRENMRLEHARRATRRK